MYHLLLEKKELTVLLNIVATKKAQEFIDHQQRKQAQIKWVIIFYFRWKLYLKRW